MRVSSKVVYVLGGAAALALLSACSGDSSGMNSGPVTESLARQTASGTVGNVLSANLQSKIHLPVTAPSHMGLAGSCASAPVAFISDTNLGQVYELDRTGVVCATLTGFSGPVGMSTDRSGNLWVANEFASNILEVSPSTGGVIATYQDPGELPFDVCIANNSGNIAVTNVSTGSNTSGNVALYTVGSTSGPTGTASASNYTSPRFCAFDKQMNAFAFDDYDQYNTGATNVGAVLPGNYTGTKNIVPLTTSNTFAGIPGGVQINGANQVVIDDTGVGLYTYNISGTALNLGTTTPFSGAGCPLGFAFAPGYKLVLTADACNDNAQLYNYPAGGTGTPFSVPSGGFPQGVAIAPTAQFARQ